MVKTKNLEVKSESQPVLNVHSAAIHIENKVDLLPRQAWFYLLYKAFPKLKTDSVFTIEIS